MAAAKRLVLFIHGWSVTHTNTYGALPERLKAEASAAGDLNIDVRNLHLGRYISFHDEVRIADLARALEEAIRRELGRDLGAGRRFAAITHSTGGPVVRDWWDRYYVNRRRAGECPMSHLIMLAPANFGSALAQLGKSRISRLKSWFEDVEPGAGVLNWLELGSAEAWDLNMRWLDYGSAIGRPDRVFPFVLTGQSIDRSLYDHLNTYTGEIGSDGVVRVAAANLNTCYVRLQQDRAAVSADGRRPLIEPANLRRVDSRTAPDTAFAILPGCSHSGADMGIMRSVRHDGKPHPTITAILKCLRVSDAASYRHICAEFAASNQEVVAAELYEREGVPILPDREYFHDPHSMVIVRVQDDSGRILTDFDLVLTAADDSPDLLPVGFLADRQKNRLHPGTLSFFFNYSVMHGAPAVKDSEGRIRRAALPGAQSMGFVLAPATLGEFVHHVPAHLKATRERLEMFLRPHETTMVDIVLRRIVRRGAFELTTELAPRSFKHQPPGEPVSNDP
jgi:hypothetical protein